MPFQSGKQRRYLWANEPEIARDWTNKYGSRIRRDNGGIMHQFENYAHDDGNNVSVPRSFQARPNTEQVNLAYITPEEEGILQMLKPDTPHIGPMNVPNYDARDARGNFGTSGQHDAPTAGDVAAGVGSTTGGGAGDTRIGTIKQDIQKVNRGIRPAGYNVNQFQNNNAVNRNRNRFSNIVGKLRGWNPITNDWNTQKQYEDARTKRQDRSRIDRLRKTRDYGKYANDPEGWRASDLSGRLTGLEKNVFGKDYVDYGRNRLQARDLKALRDKQALTSQLSTPNRSLGQIVMDARRNNPVNLNPTWDAHRNMTHANAPQSIKDFYTNSFRSRYDDQGLASLNNQWSGPQIQQAKTYGLQDLKNLGAGYEGWFESTQDPNKQLQAIQDYYDEATKYKSSGLGQDQTPAAVRDYVERMGKQAFSGVPEIDMGMVPQDFLSEDIDFTNQKSPLSYDWQI